MAKPKPRATCHPDKPAMAQRGPFAGLCSACYFRRRRAAPAPASTVEPDVVPLIDGGKLTVDEAVALTRTTLIEALPEAAAALLRTLKSDPAKGFALRAAETLLKHFPVPTAGGEPSRLLEGPAKSEGPAQTQVVIGLHVGGPGDVRVGQVVGTVEPSPLGQRRLKES